MVQNAKHFEDMAPGTGLMLRDLSRGQFGDGPVLGHVSKTFDGGFIVIDGSGNVTKGPAAVLKLNAKASMQSANAFYFNLGDLGTAGRRAVAYEGVALSPFLSWRIHSMDVPGLKKGLFYRTLIGSEYRFSTDPVIAGKIAVNEFNLSVRRALLVSALQRREIDAYDIRKALPSWLEGAFINKDLSMILSNNQVPFSGFIDYLGRALSVTDWAQPSRAGNKLFWEKVFPEKNVQAAFADLVNPSIFTTFKTVVLGQDPRTGEAYKNNIDWLDGIASAISDGRITVPRKMLKLYLEQEAATTLHEIKGMDRDLVLKRNLFAKQQKGFSVMSALLMRRYRHLNKVKMFKVIANYPKAHIKSFSKRIMKEWQVKIGDKEMNKNPFDYLIGRGIDEANALLISNELNDMKLLYGAGAVNDKTKPGDSQRIKGSFAAMSLRLIENMAGAMKVGGDEFKKEALGYYAKALGSDDQTREMNKVLYDKEE